jgi:hypothetical protein
MFKEYDPKIVDRSVIDFPKPMERSGVNRYILSVASMADEMLPWSVTPHARDRQLRKFWPSEPMMASAVYASTARVSSFEWEIIPADPTVRKPKNTIRAVTNMLQNSDFGDGWVNLLNKTLQDIYTQDNGGFWHLVRAEDRPDSPVLNIVHLDSAKCERTGNFKVPVVYTDRWGREKWLKWYQVLTLEEFPSAEEDGYGVQYSAITRALRAAQILRDIEIYKHEKVSGQFSRGIHLVSGVTQGEIDDAKVISREHSLNIGALRYSEPIIIPGIDPTAGIDVKTIELASLPDSFDEDSTMKWYVAQLAMAFGVDYQELAPLPGGNLGSSQQSEVLHMKTQGKGPALIMKIVENAINNNNILPRTVKFQFKMQDLQAERSKAEIGFLRAKDRVLRVKSGELDLKAARELAVLHGDLPEYMADEITARIGNEPPAPTLPGTAGQNELGADQITSGIESQDEQSDSANSD